ncbi:MAG: amino acid ABC transporter substrate-binding protein [Actinobacteria bacterium]|jgi:polar amino acid transport system substrate-binding protein|nr:amino acid ABC transporter substrate-binding protein [Actinomycetota bacterium]MCO5300434.1 ABC transporter substrate-binding protein [Candidatus Nanopelagicales bacterium]MCB9430098.1 amino acid ABC transporter substrate-binding protein [Actinomycetota bacterium]HPE13364.1 ABC transporter substrate-binding protein [Actinomycetota bacterium]HPQ83124.1 ABC transporter substrate-binding protein [Actinomycetota bacterium]
MRRSFLMSAALPAIAALALAGCASEADTTATDTTPSPTTSQDCSPESLQTLTPGTLTVGTDTPAYPPYFEDDDPSNGKGFESAVAYAVADELGFTSDQVTWVTVPFNKSYAPGDKDFDFDINQISITPKRQKAVDFSDGYYTVNQAVVALEDSPIANATSLAELREAKLGAQVGTTSLDFITNDIQPTQQPLVYNDTNDAKSALEAGQIDGIVVDLPTAYYVTAAEFDNAKIVGQFPAQDGGEQFGLLMAKGSPLVTCVNQALTSLKDSGELQSIQDEWLVGEDAPYFTE